MCICTNMEKYPATASAYAARKDKSEMRKLFKFLKDYKRESVLAPLFKLLEAFFELFVPQVMASIIDRGIGV
ncbi:MAG: hypothetical protein K2L18_03495, partial [Acetatifactor sp.]|nr:hypothetical protein [Acetatifactor sp.]